MHPYLYLHYEERENLQLLEISFDHALIIRIAACEIISDAFDKIAYIIRNARIFTTIKIVKYTKKTSY